VTARSGGELGEGVRGRAGSGVPAALGFRKSACPGGSGNPGAAETPSGGGEAGARGASPQRGEGAEDLVNNSAKELFCFFFSFSLKKKTKKTTNKPTNNPKQF